MRTALQSFQTQLDAIGKQTAIQPKRTFLDLFLHGYFPKNLCQIATHFSGVTLLSAAGTKKTNTIYTQFSQNVKVFRVILAAFGN